MERKETKKPSFGPPYTSAGAVDDFASRGIELRIVRVAHNAVHKLEHFIPVHDHAVHSDVALPAIAYPGDAPLFRVFNPQVVGGLLVVGAAIVLFVRKRVSKQ